jgi:hypothetical protein
MTRPISSFRGSATFTIEATIVGPAQGGTPAFGYDVRKELPEDFTEFNIQAAIRICNAFAGKVKRYRNRHATLSNRTAVCTRPDHVSFHLAGCDTEAFIVEGSMPRGPAITRALNTCNRTGCASAASALTTLASSLRGSYVNSRIMEVTSEPFVCVGLCSVPSSGG